MEIKPYMYIYICFFYILEVKLWDLVIKKYLLELFRF